MFPHVVSTLIHHFFLSCLCLLPPGDHTEARFGYRSHDFVSRLRYRILCHFVTVRHLRLSICMPIGRVKPVDLPGFDIGPDVLPFDISHSETDGLAGIDVEPCWVTGQLTNRNGGCR